MKKFFIVAFLFFPVLVFGSAKDLVKYIPADSFTVIGADFIPLRANAIFVSLEQSGKVWSDPKESDLTGYFKILNIDPHRDVKTFLFSKYLNSYGSKGDLRIFEFTRDISLPKEGSMKYLNAELYRIDPDLDVYAAQVSPKMLALGDLNEAKMAVDLAERKIPQPRTKCQPLRVAIQGSRTFSDMGFGNSSFSERSFRTKRGTQGKPHPWGVSRLLFLWHS